jgi:hypothetical protein
MAADFAEVCGQRLRLAKQKCDGQASDLGGRFQRFVSFLESCWCFWKLIPAGL